MIDNLKLFLKGVIIGLGKIIPGVSGAMLAITFGVYEKGVNAISHFFTDLKKNFSFLLYLGLGICLGIIVGSKLVLFFLNRFYLQTMFLFVGMIIGGLSPVVDQLKNNVGKNKIIFSIIIFVFLILISFFDFNNNNHSFNYSVNYFFIMILCGALDAAATVIPGISGTALLMIIGYYDIIMQTYSTILSTDKIVQNIFTLIPYISGMLIGIILISRLMDYLIKNHKLIVNYMILGFASSSIVLLVTQAFNHNYSVFSIFISLIFLAIGYCVTLVLGKY